MSANDPSIGSQCPVVYHSFSEFTQKALMDDAIAFMDDEKPSRLKNVSVEMQQREDPIAPHVFSLKTDKDSRWQGEVRLKFTVQNKAGTKQEHEVQMILTSDCQDRGTAEKLLEHAAVGLKAMSELGTKELQAHRSTEGTGTRLKNLDLFSVKTRSWKEILSPKNWSIKDWFSLLIRPRAVVQEVKDCIKESRLGSHTVEARVTREQEKAQEQGVSDSNAPSKRPDRPRREGGRPLPATPPQGKQVKPEQGVSDSNAPPKRPERPHREGYRPLPATPPQGKQAKQDKEVSKTENTDLRPLPKTPKSKTPPERPERPTEEI